MLLDVDDNPYLAVSLADEPDEDRDAHGRFLYFSPTRSSTAVETEEPRDRRGRREARDRRNRV